MSGLDKGVAVTSSANDDLETAVDQIRAITQRMATDAVEIGRILISVKRSLPHGSYLPWLKSSFGWTERTASNFVNVAEKIGENAKYVSHLPMATVYQLAAPSTPLPMLDGIFRRFESGELVQRSEIDSQLSQVRRMNREVEQERKDTERKSPEAIQQAKMRKTKEKDKRDKEATEWGIVRAQQNAARASIVAFLIEALDDEAYMHFKSMMQEVGSLHAGDLFRLL